LAIAAEGAAGRDDPERAVDLLREFDDSTFGHAAMYRSAVSPSVVRTALAVDARELAGSFVGRSEPVTMRDQLFTETSSALVAEAGGSGDPAVLTDLEKRWRVYGNRYEQGCAAAALGRLTGDEVATTRGLGLLHDLGVPT
jgi:hypothetical protein